MSRRWIVAGILISSLIASAASSQDSPSPEGIENWSTPQLWKAHRLRPLDEPATSETGARPQQEQNASSPLPLVAASPCRIIDTRGNGFTGPYGPPALAAGSPRSFTLTGQCGIAATAQAVSLNITVTNTLGPGFIKIFPQGGTSPVVSTLNYIAGQTVANAAVVPLGAGGGVTIAAGVSGTDLIVDTNGYYDASGLITQVSPGTGLSGGGTSGNVTLGIAAGGVTSTELATNAVTSTKIAANAVTGGAIASGAVTDAKVTGPITFSKVGGATAGGILFGGPSGALSQDAANLFWDSTNHRLGLGTATPSQQLEITGMMSMPDTAVTSGIPTAGVLWMGVSTFLHNTGGTSNTYLGKSAGTLTASAVDNTAVGNLALGLVADGSYNTAVGFQSLTDNTHGSSNTAIGTLSLANNRSGHVNVAVGYFSLRNNDFTGANTAVGYAALSSHSYFNGGIPWSSYDTAVGWGALGNNLPTSTTNGIDNTAVGAQGLEANTTGFQNTAVGFNAGNQSGASIGYGSGAITYVPVTTGAFNTFVGVNTGATANDIGNCTAVGIDAYCDASNEVRLGNIFVTSIGGKVAWSALSDARAKKNIRDLSLGLDFVLRLHPVEYELKLGNEKTDMGFVAQDVEALLGENYNVLTVGGDSDRTLSLRYTDLIAPLVKAVQEQNRLIEELRERVRLLENELRR